MLLVTAVAAGLVAAVCVVLPPGRARAANREYHNHGYAGAPDVGNWAWHTRDNGEHVWWMKHHWVEGTGSYGELRNGQGFEVEWFDGGRRDKCDVFDVDPHRVHISSNGIAFLGVVNGCGTEHVLEQAEFMVVNKAALPQAVPGVNNDGVWWSLIGTVPDEPVPCPAPDPGGACRFPEVAEGNLEWKSGNTWLGKVSLGKCYLGPTRYRCTISDPAGLAAPNGC
ncbi:MAG: hypothetical protein ACK2UL_04505 [Anaerolineae bacterium]